MPRGKRIKGRGESYYHIVTRIVDQIYRFTDSENSLNVKLLRKVEEFSAVEVISYCFMSNHVHLLLRVPERKPVSEAELEERIKALYGEDRWLELQQRWLDFGDDVESVEAEKNAFRKRMYDMGEFMKTFKQRLTQSYNMRNDRKGTLWEERYKSLLLEATPEVLSAVASYIDLNPVRAGMVSDPEEYTFSSYGEACWGGKKARTGLCRLYQNDGKPRPSWEEVAPQYRDRLMVKVGATKKRKRIRLKEVQAAVLNQGKVLMSELLGNRIGFFTRGKAFGSASFVNDVRGGSVLSGGKETVPS